MTADVSLLALFVNASFIVQMVMLVLLLASIASWTLIFQRWKVMKTHKDAVSKFERTFWSGAELNSLYQKLSPRMEQSTGSQKLFLSGFKEFRRQCQLKSANKEQILSGVERTLDIELAKQSDKLEQHLPFLATVQSISPYIGLFGTVWGIMHAFRALSGSQQATLAMVAPGLAEALIATAIGLIAAIPAGIAYNRFTGLANQISRQYELFAAELVNLLNRQLQSVQEESLKSNAEIAEANKETEQGAL